MVPPVVQEPQLSVLPQPLLNMPQVMPPATRLAQVRGTQAEPLPHWPGVPPPPQVLPLVQTLLAPQFIVEPQPVWMLREHMSPEAPTAMSVHLSDVQVMVPDEP